MSKKVKTKYLVTVSIDEIIDCNRQEFMELLSMLAVEHECLEDMSYRVVGTVDELITVSIIAHDPYANGLPKYPEILQKKKSKKQ